ncbi:MAG TPA: tRNA 2-thiouridine(34) synthase MnmA [Polyangiaceae bacterium]|jgi:tRNA-specific 2-thiouridylase|nr:tRNA 2-thiouridine(34) synthase MnmA [Polyangiaceae bacterium]
MPERVLIAMSGGVDSSVAAARLCAQGFDVVGVTLHLWDYPDDGSVKSRCCAPEDVHDARRVADLLKIPHYAFDRRELFQREVVAPFVEAYLEGETPSPCVRCNRGVKIKELFQLADRLSADRVATGHYARVVRPGEHFELHRGRDHGKDQSYFLHMLGQRALSRLLFPLGESDKPEIREEALRLGLPGAQKGESQELCFVPTGRYDRFVAERADGRVRPGAILNEQGERVGEHDGIFRFTLGQRKNLGVALGQRAYVVGVDAERATVTLGPVDSLYSASAALSELALAEDLSLPLRCGVQVRYRGAPAPAEVRRVGEQAHVFFDEPQRAVVPGQFAVFYAGERVLGGGMIDRTERAERVARADSSAESFA